MYWQTILPLLQTPMLTVCLLGKPEIYDEDKTPIVFPSAEEEAIFCYLVYVKQPVLHTKLAAFFWPHLTLPAALAEWQRRLPPLQKLLGDALRVTPKQAAFNRQSEHSVDYYDLERLLKAVKMPNRQKLERLRALYRGPFLAEVEEVNSPDFIRWRQQQRSLLHERVIEELHLLSEHFLDNRDFALGFKSTQWWLTLQPGDESAHRLRMLLFWRNGQRSAALLQYNICNDYLQLHHGSGTIAGNSPTLLTDPKRGCATCRRYIGCHSCAATTTKTQPDQKADQLCRSRKRVQNYSQLFA